MAMGANGKTSLVLMTLILVVGLSASRALAQDQRTLEGSSPSPGPTIGAWTDTASDLRTPQPELRADILPRHEAMQRELAAEFGATASDDKKGYPFGFDRWNDTAIHRLVKWGVSTYGQIRESTQFETKGFNLGVEVDDLADGKIGLRIDRSLD